MKPSIENIDSYEKAYKVICKRIGARCIEVGRNLYLVYALLEDGRYESIQDPKSSSTFFSLYSPLYVPRQFRSIKAIVNFLLKTAKHDQLKCNGKIAVYKNESLESLAIEADLIE